jgi:hypothetical protein
VEKKKVLIFLLAVSTARGTRIYYDLSLMCCRVKGKKVTTMLVSVSQAFSFLRALNAPFFLPVLFNTIYRVCVLCALPCSMLLLLSRTTQHNTATSPVISFSWQQHITLTTTLLPYVQYNNITNISITIIIIKLKYYNILSLSSI